MAQDRYEVILAGSGGQGLVVSGIMLAEAAILEEKNVVQTVSYGIASRGGFSMAEVILDTEEILFQQVQQADVVLVLTEEAMEKFHSMTQAGTWIVYDATLLKAQHRDRFHGIALTAMAADLGNTAMANILGLGFIAQAFGVVKTESLAQVIGKRFAGEPRDLNLRALRAGADLALGLPSGAFARGSG